MLGDFLKDFHENRAVKLTPDEVKKLTPGTALVCIANPEELQSEGLPSNIRFAIRAEEEDTIIVQNPLTHDWNNPSFQIIRFDIDRLDVHFYLYGESINTDCTATLKRASERLDSITTELRSMLGDDFVDECITGKSIEEIFSSYDTSAGQHWWTPLIVDGEFIMSQAKAVISEAIEKTKASGNKASVITYKTIYKTLESVRVPKNFQTPEVEHHGVVIERGRVIHFSNSRIRVDHFRKFIETTSNSSSGGTAGGRNEQLELSERLYTRNRIINVFYLEGIISGYWGKYNLFTNNCEHFSRAGRENRRVSCQVIKESINAVQNILSMLPIPGIGGMITGILAALLNLSSPQNLAIGKYKNKTASYDELKAIMDNA